MQSKADNAIGESILTSAIRLRQAVGGVTSRLWQGTLSLMQKRISLVYMKQRLRTKLVISSKETI
jgi:hypothetical protein